jgi:hypothetical protein
MENYTWFYKSKYDGNARLYGSESDKIGISSDGKSMIHDGIINNINLFKRVKANKTIRVIYKLEDQQNLMFSSRDAFIYFKFEEVGGKEPVFSYLGFNGGEYRERLVKN